MISIFRTQLEKTFENDMLQNTKDLL